MQKETNMTDTVKLEAVKREEDKTPRKLRQEGFLTATVYGKGMDSLSIQVCKKEFVNAYKKNPAAKFDVVVDKNTYKTEVKNVQQNYSTAEELNIEFKLV